MVQLLERMKEPSSYAGLAAILGVIGINVDPGLMQHIIIGLTAISGIAAFFLKEKKS
jgi:hypothetical protein